ncbi:ATP-binding protein [Fulvivirga sp.]|uniref:ATP-binding protein n=1 Tax=Fulvivirga sp. TaxID=1931237 RepID=UPI0032EE23C4
MRAKTFINNSFPDVNHDLDNQDEDVLDRVPHERDYIFTANSDSAFTDNARFLELPSDFFYQVLNNGEANYRDGAQYFKGVLLERGSSKYIVISSAENYFETHHETYLKKVLLIAVIIAVLISILIIYNFQKYISKPLREITNKVKEISSENLHLRLDNENSNNVDLKELVNTFNTMLDRIETSFETQNNFISNASHELSTPLTAIIGIADVTLVKPRDQKSYIEAFEVILEQAESLDQKTKALLFLAQTGFNGKAQKFDKLRVDQLILDVQETLKKINPKNQIKLDLNLLPENPMKLKVNGNEQLLHLAFSNVISNACKYSNFADVIVSIGASENNVWIVVRDSGIGIPKTELQFIYDPFFRASNTKPFEGYGIGLPLTRNIIRMHKGELIVSSIQNQGTTVQIKLPFWEGSTRVE